MIAKTLFSILIGAGFLFLSFHRVNFSEIENALPLVHWGYLFFVILVSLIINVLRSWRLKLLLHHLHQISFKKIFKINAVGYTFITLMPMRLGEFAIPYMISKDSRISIKSFLSVIFLERLIGLIALLGFLVFLTFDLLSQKWLQHTAFILSIGVLVLIVIIAVSYKKSQWILNILQPLFNRLPTTLVEKIRSTLSQARTGFHVINSPGILFSVLFLSVVVWFCSAFIVWLMFQALSISLAPKAAITVMVFNVIGLSIPAGPAMIGNFQYSCILALSIYGVNKSTAFIFANIYYLLSIGLTTLLGTIFMPFINVKIKDIVLQFRRKDIQNESSSTF